MNNNTILGIIVAAVIGAAAGYAGAVYQYSAQINKVKSAFPMQTSVTSVAGTIQSISGNTITILSSPSGNPFENLPTTRTVTVTSATKIVKSTLKDPAVFQQEMAAYQKAVQKVIQKEVSSTTLPTMPTPAAETTLDISKLKVGDMVSVDAGKDVATATSFDAVVITVTAEAFAVPGGTASTTAVGMAPAPAGSTPPLTNTAITPPPAGTNGTAPVVTAPPPVRK